MNYLMSVVLGIVQGVAEFLPISSSGHLTLFQHFFGLPEPDLLFNVLLHFATLIAVFIYYRRDIAEMIVEFVRGVIALFSPTRRGERVPDARRMVFLVIVGTLPLFLVLPFKDHIEALGASPVFVSCALLVTGGILFLADRIGSGRKKVRSATVVDVLLVGLAQGCATVPGLSRSGCTISAGMARGFDRRFAVRFSFLLSLPAVLGATLLEAKDVLTDPAVLSPDLLPKYLLGMLVAGVVGYLSLGLLNVIVRKGKFGAFAYYCWGAGVVSLILCLTGWLPVA